MSGAGDRFWVLSLVADGGAGGFLLDRRGRVREWGSAAAAVRALQSAGEDLAAWRIYWRPAGSTAWRLACLACDAGDVFAGR